MTVSIDMVNFLTDLGKALLVWTGGACITVFIFNLLQPLFFKGIDRAKPHDIRFWFFMWPLLTLVGLVILTMKIPFYAVSQAVNISNSIIDHKYPTPLLTDESSEK